MTNLCTKTAIITLSALLITLVGCKKDDEYGIAFLLDTNSMDFEWGQTKELGFTTDRVTGIDITDVTAGWTCTRSGNKFIITAPAQGGESTGSISFSASTETATVLSRTLTVAVRIPEEIPGMANSHIVSTPGKRYKFSALKQGGESGKTITGATAATRVWTTSTTAIINVSLENGYVCFATGDSTELEEANAILAVTDSKGVILWSWHIWVTDYDPAADPDILDGKTVMNRNLGAFANSDATPEEAVRSYGLYYQWGRKDPFVGPVTWNSTVPRSMYTTLDRHTTHNYTVSTDETGTIDYSISHPNTFISGNKNNNFDWLAKPNTTELWNAASKSNYDPCPAGWRVAPREIWNGFTTTGGASSDPAGFSVEGEYGYGWNFINGEKTIFYPAAGRRSFSPSLASLHDNFTNVVNDDQEVGYPVGFYWSNTYPIPSIVSIVGGKSGSLVFRRDYVNPAYQGTDAELSEYAPAGGFPVRCVAE